MHRPFQVDYVRYLMTHRDVYQYSLGRTTSSRELRIATACDVLSHPDYLPSIRTAPKVKGEWLFVPDRFEDKLFIRHLNLRLLKAYRVRFAHRDDVVRQVCALLRSDAPMSIIRTDIRRFFRHIRFMDLVDQLRLDGHLSSHDITSLAALAERAARLHHYGLPWGFPISSTLAEIYARPFDAKVRSTATVLYCARFVDDIVVFASSPAAQIREQIEKAVAQLPGRIRLNKTKTECIDESAHGHSGTRFSYLGYAFSRPPPVTKLQTTPTITIDERKLERICTRIECSFRQYLTDWVLADLIARLRLLTGNYTITRANHRRVARTGICYSYRAATHWNQLIELDKFLRYRIAGLRARLTREGRPMRKGDLRSLLRFSFQHGAEQKFIHRISRRRLQYLFRAWKHEA